MRVLIQRVSQASVEVHGDIIAEIGEGFLILFCAMKGDTKTKAELLAKKVANLRVFEDKNGRMNYSLIDTRGSALVISQFTLGADTSRGNRPGFSGIAPPEEGERLYKHFRHTLSEFGIATQIGIYGKTMRVDLTNEGPVTIWLDTQKH